MLFCGLYNEFLKIIATKAFLWKSFGSQWSSDSIVLNSSTLELSNVYNSNFIGLYYFDAYWLFAAFN